MERGKASSDSQIEDSNYPPHVKWCKRCSAYHFSFSLWQRFAHMIRLKSQYSTFQIVPVYSQYRLDPDRNRHRQKKRKEQKKSRMKNRASR